MSIAVHDPTRLEQMIDMERPNLILLDVVMPQRNGFQACRELKGNADYCPHSGGDGEFQEALRVTSSGPSSRALTVTW